MNAKLDRISDSISEMKETLDQLSRKNDIDIVRNFKDIKQDYLDMLNAIKVKKEYSENEYRSLTNRMYSVLEYLYDCFMMNASGNNDTLLEAIFSLLPMFANLLCKFDTVYHFNHLDVAKDDPWHLSHRDWNTLFEKFMGKEFLDKLQDYCFLNKNLSSRASLDAVSTTFLMVLNGKTAVEDQQDILICFDSFKEYADFENETLNEAMNDVKQESKELDEDILELLNPALAKAARQFAVSAG